MLAKVCSRSQGQPSAERKRSMIASNAARLAVMSSAMPHRSARGRAAFRLARAASAAASSACRRLRPRCCARRKECRTPRRQIAHLALARLVVGGVQDEVQRHLEHIVHLGRRDAQLERGIDEADRRRHAKTGDHPVIGQVSGKLHEALATARSPRTPRAAPRARRRRPPARCGRPES